MKQLKDNLLWLSVMSPFAAYHLFDWKPGIDIGQAGAWIFILASMLPVTAIIIGKVMAESGDDKDGEMAELVFKVGKTFSKNSKLSLAFGWAKSATSFFVYCYSGLVFLSIVYAVMCFAAHCTMKSLVEFYRENKELHG